MLRPIIAIVGRPNVGKSTLFNRMVGRRRALVRDVPGVTRDRLYGTVAFERWQATVVDTGGFEPRPTSDLVAGVRSQVWWTLREDLRLNRIALPFDLDLFKDLTAPTFGTPNNKIAVEGKDKLRGRLGRSPNKGDAVAYWNWVRRRSPLNTRIPPSPISKNEDRGLERLLARHTKQREQEDRRFQRMLRQRQKGKKR